MQYKFDKNGIIEIKEATDIAICGILENTNGYSLHDSYIEIITKIENLDEFGIPFNYAEFNIIDYNDIKNNNLGDIRCVDVYPSDYLYIDENFGILLKDFVGKIEIKFVGDDNLSLEDFINIINEPGKFEEIYEGMANEYVKFEITGINNIPKDKIKTLEEIN